MNRIISNTLLVLGLLIFVIACNQPTTNTQKPETIEEAVKAIDPIFTQNPAPDEFTAKFFTGKVGVRMMLGNDENNEYSIANVIFDPESRTNWHTHPKGQVLLVLAGEGFYKAEGEPVQKIKKGDVVNIPPHVNHWHGAAPNSEFVHVALTNYKEGKNVTWGEPVSDEDYKSVMQ
ncbi:cupin domain-containing protein [Draconibacterium sp. IB214405]|uniref:(R)-mandelonitrile lyase n=1 Tax=Draconibacterium sp. IB214405 TaxID=3097352 RepID=UPI002A169F90|nr:cupin domain-containing protein [Draconibacterium sp. IB214405]MDX8339424.1 cupin domain-containing protein [Draconibacterium sp. IB214405]